MTISNPALMSEGGITGTRGVLREQGDAVGLLARVESLPPRGVLVRARVLIGVATFFDAFDVLAIAYVLPTLVGLWELTPQQIGLLISSGFAGQLIGALFFGWLAERVGRLPVATVTVAIFGVFSLACAFAPSYGWLLALRFIQGVGLGGEVPVAAAYINELSRARGRGRFFMIYELIFPLGLLLAAGLGSWLVPRFGWESMFVIGALPAFLALFLRRALPESPRWLIDKGRLTEARAALERIERSAGVTPSHAAAAAAAPMQIVAPDVQAPRRLELLRAPYLGRTLTVWAIWISAYFITYGLTAWLPTVYRTVFKLPVETALQYGLLTSFAGFLGSALCAFLIDKVGRRLWMTVGLIVGGVLLSVAYFVGVSDVRIVLLTASSGYFFIASVATMLYLYTPELYPTRMRAFASGAASSWLRIASIAGPTIIGSLIASGGLDVVFAMLALVAIAGGLIAMFFAVETSGRQLEEVSP
jgi:putative MFS transporter